MFENKVLRRIFGPKSDELTGEWRKLQNEEINDLYCSLCSGDQIEKNEMGGARIKYCERRGVHRVLVGNSE